MRRFEPGDFDTMNDWYRARGLPRVPRGALPEVGLIEPGVAAGFLYRTDAAVTALLDAFVACPDAPLRARRAAMVSIIEGLCAEAKAKGHRVIVGLTERRSMAQLCEGLGFRSKGLCELLRKEV